MAKPESAMVADKTLKVSIKKTKAAAGAGIPVKQFEGRGTNMKPLEDGLEDVLEKGKLPDSGSALGAFLAANPTVRDEVTGMIEISRLLRENFCVNDDERDELSPAPGFYARVMAGIELQNAQPSFWNFFVDPFGARLAYASLALATLLLAANFFDNTRSVEAPIAQNQSVQVLHGALLVSDSDELPVVESNDIEADRGATLFQLTTYDQ